MSTLARLTILSVVLMAATGPWQVPPAAACVCEPTSVRNQLPFIDSVFAAKVVHVQPSDGQDVTVLAAADHVWVGDAEPIMTVRTQVAPDSCGYPFEEGMRYLVFGFRDTEGIRVSLCSNTSPYGTEVVAELQSVVGRGRPVSQDYADWPAPRLTVQGRTSRPEVAPRGATTRAELGIAVAATAILCATAMLLARRG